MQSKSVQKSLDKWNTQWAESCSKQNTTGCADLFPRLSARLSQAERYTAYWHGSAHQDTTVFGLSQTAVPKCHVCGIPKWTLLSLRELASQIDQSTAVFSQGAEYFKKEYERLERLLESGNVGGSKAGEISRKLSVLGAFLEGDDVAESWLGL